MTDLFPAGLPTPAPDIDPQTFPYWEGARAGRLVLPWCSSCAQPFWYPRGFCPRCGSEDIDWRPASGTGQVYSFTVVRRAGGVWAAHLPFVLGLVQLAEGPVVQANIVDTDSDELAVGQAVLASFENAAPDDPPVLRFRPVRP